MAGRRRRHADPLICQYLWDAILIIRSHKQLPSFDRIRRYMSRTHDIDSKEVQKHLDKGIDDELVAVTRKLGQKGSKTGVEQEGYRTPNIPTERESHDWYCFDCHRGGEVLNCSKCYRVFHETCTKVEDCPVGDEPFVCVVCKLRAQQRSVQNSISREDLNKLLVYTVARLKEKLPGHITDRVIPLGPKSSPYLSDRLSSQQLQPSRLSESLSCVSPNEPWRAQLLLYHQMDLSIMEQKVRAGRYRSVYDFEVDALTIVHNVVIYHGVHSTLADQAREMLRDCQHDLVELQKCRDCYRLSNKKSDKLWFCRPCHPPHDLVYAKLKGFPFWPAKVIGIENKQYDVRFFGSQHQKALIDESNIRSISVNIHAQQVKRTSAWNKACEELLRHQELLALQEAGEISEEDVEEQMPMRVPSAHDESTSPVRDMKGEKSMGQRTQLSKRARPLESSDSEGEDSDESLDDISSTWKGRSRDSKTKRETIGRDDIVSSSSQEPRLKAVAVQTSERLAKTLVDKYNDKGNKKGHESLTADVTAQLQRKFDSERQKLLELTHKQHERELAEVRRECDKKLAELMEKHRTAISETKKKQWCFVCEEPSIYYCCWNSTYCSPTCQQVHWRKEHKRLCRRKDDAKKTTT